MYAGFQKCETRNRCNKIIGMGEYKIRKQNGRIIVEDDMGEIFNMEDNGRAVEIIKNSTNIDYWTRQEIARKLLNEK